jgi:hypothetical protein
MDNIIKKVKIIKGLLANIEREVTNVYINKLIFDKTKKRSFKKLQLIIKYDLNCNANICFTHYEDGETYCFCSIHIHFVRFVNKGVGNIFLKRFKRNPKKKIYFFQFHKFA